MNFPRGELREVANGCLSYDFFEASSELVYVIGALLKNRFEFEEHSAPVIGTDSIIWDFDKMDIKLMVGWDSLSGCFVMSLCEKGNEFITQIQTYLENL